MCLLLLVYNHLFIIMVFAFAKVNVYLVNSDIAPVFLWNHNISEVITH